MQPLRYQAIVIGLSAGGMQALKLFIPVLPAGFPLPIAIAQHVEEHSDGFLAEYLNQNSVLMVKEAEDKEPVCAGYIYIAPPGYHLLVEKDRTFSLSVDARVNYCRPSIDVLFESAVDAFGDTLIGVVLTGANADGSRGLKAVKDAGGYAIVQNPATAEALYMPAAALEATPVDSVIDIEELAPLLVRLGSQPRPEREDAHACG